MYHILAPKCHGQDSARLGEYHPLRAAPADAPGLVHFPAAVFARIACVDEECHLAAAGGGLDSLGAVDQLALAGLHAKAVERRLPERSFDALTQVGRHCNLVRLECAL